ncbi:MAG: 3-deoxy-manno-octulosonate cytidylyltransferase [Deltaproteobacteria bacterium]|nr:3-deoxy-manno-octulosonate cytidylyltransferase [Deltaproteobacteria bacterium]
MSLPPVHGIIPARYASTRFPGKPLADILGRPMFWHVWQRALQCPLLASVTLATEDERIRSAAAALGTPVLMTSGDLASGTDRVHEAALLLRLPEDSIVVNIQGDEPALDPAVLTDLAGAFAGEEVRAATLVYPLSAREAASPDRVKAVLASNGDALYFSRALIPHARDGLEERDSGKAAEARENVYWGHMGIYAFRLPVLRLFTSLPPSPLERTEKLEQLRLLENGIPLRAVKTGRGGLGVDRPEDLRGVLELMLRETRKN